MIIVPFFGWYGSILDNAYCNHYLHANIVTSHINGEFMNEENTWNIIEYNGVYPKNRHLSIME